VVGIETCLVGIETCLVGIETCLVGIETCLVGIETNVMMHSLGYGSPESATLCSMTDQPEIVHMLKGNLANN
jgi:hypothetical protein